MTQQERSGLNEAAEISAHAAGAVRGAIKTGKAVSGAAKGAAAAGPYGAAAAALWTHRKAAAAIIAGLLVLPVLFIMLLPSLIFGGLTKAGIEGSPDTPILNDNAAIVENINQISQAISDLLEEGQEDVRARIDTDFTASGADQKEIINPYESSPAYNANRFIAMYCAAKNQDYASISLKDMETLIRKAKDALYTFASTEEPRTTTVTDTTVDQKTGKVTVTETEVTEIWKIYTIVYNGEVYFEDKIFALSDEQKGLAENYAQNLSVFLGDGMMQGLLPAESTGLVSLGDIRFSDSATQVVYYNQLDKRYASKPYGTDNIGTYGCGPMVIMAPEMVRVISADPKECKACELYLLTTHCTTNLDSSSFTELYADYDAGRFALLQSVREEQQDGCVKDWADRDVLEEEYGIDRYEAWYRDEYFENHFVISLEKLSLMLPPDFIENPKSYN